MMSDLLILAGLGLIVGGVGWIYPPAAVVVLGVILTGAGIVRGRYE